MASAFHQKQQIAGLNLGITSPKKIGDKAAYQSPIQDPQQSELCALSTTFLRVYDRHS